MAGRSEMSGLQLGSTRPRWRERKKCRSIALCEREKSMLAGSDTTKRTKQQQTCANDSNQATYLATQSRVQQAYSAAQRRVRTPKPGGDAPLYPVRTPKRAIAKRHAPRKKNKSPPRLTQHEPHAVIPTRTQLRPNQPDTAAPTAPPQTNEPRNQNPKSDHTRRETRT